MTTLQRSGRPKTPFTVVRVRRIKHRAPTAVGPNSRRAASPDLASLILYGQG